MYYYFFTSSLVPRKTEVHIFLQKPNTTTISTIHSNVKIIFMVRRFFIKHLYFFVLSEQEQDEKIPFMKIFFSS